ncbi:cyclic nucleotide-binding domain-containing protein [Parasulfuritortus cantonensis]|uniref:Cyclic nucleotide-binding domain-containing protein n=1 Tax=Parasulfuritortus cantonensis TaxID=2528202 RepID=A0A4R1BKU5_9PROT|nr:cyclic nucleotide-binding domain-containing protein [Parasulfuritortus cantonensis]TCJ17964.1 cyclic nucleotide-binding domain-containing protein [Parasulfuritortus cantonensis]
MSNNQCIILGSVLGKDLSEEECELFTELGTVREMKDGEVLIKEGEVDNSLHIVIAGNLAVTRPAAGGDWVTLHVLRHGELAGELGFIDGLEHTATLRALGPTAVFSMTRERFDPLLDSNPHMVFRVMRAIIRGVHNTLRRMNQQQVEMNNYITHQHGRY